MIRVAFRHGNSDNVGLRPWVAIVARVVFGHGDSDTGGFQATVRKLVKVSRAASPH